MLTAALLGLLEGLTEFIPVSSTGHLLLAGRFLGFEAPGKTFEVVIQLGAILALLTVYAARLGQILRTARTDARARRAIASIALAFLPAVVAGVLFHRIIKEVLFESPMLIAWMLIAGGVVLLVVDRLAPEKPRHHDALAIPPGKSLAIGLFQCLAMVPGVSRSGATIVGALLLGVEKRAAAEFSFFLSIPTMVAAVGYDLLRNRAVLDTSALGEIAIGLAFAFLAAMLVVRFVLGYIGSHGYAAFGWWRILVGTAALLALAVSG